MENPIILFGKVSVASNTKSAIKVAYTAEIEGVQSTIRLTTEPDEDGIYSLEITPPPSITMKI